MRLLRSEWAFAVLVGLLALGLYLRTLYPGLVGDGDTPKFQYVGAVAGTPHNPGYPLYLLVSYAFSRLPMGNLAWRINLMSAVCAALAVALLVLVQRALGCGRAVSAAVALAAACGPIFWSQATLAEVYTLAAALLAGLLVPLVHWGRTRREARRGAGFTPAERRGGSGGARPSTPPLNEARGCRLGRGEHRHQAAGETRRAVH